MKECENCLKTFPSAMKINGKRKVLSSRKYCLECSPYKLHNTTKISGPISAIKICSKHPDSEFSTPKNGGRRRCRACTVDAVVKYRRNVKLRAIEYKGGKCIRCDYNKCVAALHFHHIDPDTKEFSIGKTGVTRSWAKLKKELDKCELLCSNCHAEHHNTA